MRSIVRRVHPDLFAAHPQERAQNSESLKVWAPIDAHLIAVATPRGPRNLAVCPLQALNNYVGSSAKRQVQQSVPISFWVREDDSFVKVEAELPSHGSLGPLFYAFGLITDEELRQGYGSYDAGGLVKFRLQSNTARSCLRSLGCACNFPHLCRTADRTQSELVWTQVAATYTQG